MTGVAIASSLQFIMRFTIVFILARCDKDLEKSWMPLFHEDSFKNLGHIVEVGW